jgi:D-arabinose 5-phosphate isomerase GutQ
MSLAKQNIDRQLAAIQNLYPVLETKEYQEIVSAVSFVATNSYKSRVLMAGVGKNANIASKIAETMASLGIPSMPLNVSHLGHGDFGYIGHTDVIIHISRSGTTNEMLVAIEHIARIRPGVTQILIHCKPTKPKNETVDFELCIGAVKEGDEHGLAPTTSTTALLCILDCISVEASHAANFGRLDFLKYHPDGALGEMLKAETAKAGSLEKPEPGREFA